MANPTAYYFSWGQDTNGAPTGWLTLHALTQAGQYEFRYLYVLADSSAGRRADAERLAAANKGFPNRQAIPCRQVMIYAALRDLDRAFAALDEVAVREPHRVGLLLVRPETAALRADPRLASFRKSFGLP